MQHVQEAPGTHPVPSKRARQPSPLQQPPRTSPQDFSPGREQEQAAAPAREEVFTEEDIPGTLQLQQPEECRAEPKIMHDNA